jgi:hypothetical protein
LVCRVLCALLVCERTAAWSSALHLLLARSPSW